LLYPTDKEGALLTIIPHLTGKQIEVLHFVAENRTSKEIAWHLGISESAVNQRIEGARRRAGWPPRAELARAFRTYLQQRQVETALHPVTDCASQQPQPTAA
jgi:DNA-binding CsgD family transcriptional regulator